MIIRVFGAALALASAGFLNSAQAASCSKSDELRISAIGDILVHGAIYEPANSSRKGFSVIWESLEELFDSADVSYGNLEGTAAAGVSQAGRSVRDPGRVYNCHHPRAKDGTIDMKRNGSEAVYCSTNFLFNYHPDIVQALKDSGIDVLSTANNHSLDRGRLGIDRTIEAMERANMAYTGTRHSEKNNPFYAVTNNKGWRVAWIGCTDIMNWGKPHAQILTCRGEATLNLIRQLSNDSRIDAVIVTPHWGAEYAVQHNSSQSSLAKIWAEAGATAIIGSHAHVLQPTEILTTKSGRKVPVAYSLGNFIAGQRALERRVSAVLFITLSRRSGQTELVSFDSVPIIRDGYVVRTVDELSRRSRLGAEERGVHSIIRRSMSATRVLRPDQVCQ